MRRLFLAAVVVAAGGLATQAADPTPTASPELARLNGLWKPRSVLADGAEQFPTPASRASITLAMKDGVYALWEVIDPAKQTGRRICTAQIKMDSSTKAVEMEIVRGPKVGQKMHGVYEVNGNELRFCHGPADKPRPTTFAAPAGSGLICETWQLEKP